MQELGAEYASLKKDTSYLELKFSDEKFEKSEKFVQKMNTFLANARAEMQSVAILIEEAQEKTKKVILFYGEDPERLSFKDFLLSIVEFVSTYQVGQAWLLFLLWLAN